MARRPQRTVGAPAPPPADTAILGRAADPTGWPVSVDGALWVLTVGKGGLPPPPGSPQAVAGNGAPTSVAAVASNGAVLSNAKAYGRGGGGQFVVGRLTRWMPVRPCVSYMMDQYVPGAGGGITIEYKHALAPTPSPLCGAIANTVAFGHRVHRRRRSRLTHRFNRCRNWRPCMHAPYMSTTVVGAVYLDGVSSL
ncbi:fascin-like domain-containing protein [Pandoravirus kuranda]|uniref:Fascin-like domain-containing protein n=1 Tax=Pandoravirus kuranda TaxID=3019033 RepID=A0AA95ED72_9VIRU|nr:fascin-like domain-containing protein [Pandoravirus kuranda]